MSYLETRKHQLLLDFLRGMKEAREAQARIDAGEPEPAPAPESDTAIAARLVDQIMEQRFLAGLEPEDEPAPYSAMPAAQLPPAPEGCRWVCVTPEFVDLLVGLCQAGGVKGSEIRRWIHTALRVDAPPPPPPKAKPKRHLRAVREGE